MRQIIAYIVFLLNNPLASATLVVISAAILGLYQKYFRRSKTDPKVPATALLILLFPIAMSFAFASYITNPLMYYLGVETNGRVVSIESIPETYNERQVYRHHVIFRNEADEIIETSFKTSDFNVYPISNSVRYPSSGENFTLRYMAHAPSEFVIIRDETKHKLAELYQERSTLQEKIELDPTEKLYKDQLAKIELEIKALQGEEKKDEVETLTELDYSFEDIASEVTTVDSIHFSPTHEIALVNLRYKGYDGRSEDALISISLKNQLILNMLPIDAFEKVIGVVDNKLYLHDWSDEHLFSYHIETLEPVTLEPELANADWDPILVGDYLIKHSHSTNQNTVHFLTTETNYEMPQDSIQHMVRNHDWEILTIEQQNNHIETMMKLQSISDFRQYFNAILADESMAHKHNTANSALFHSQGKTEVNTMSYVLTNQMLEHSVLKTEFSNQTKRYDSHEVMGQEADGSLYALGLKDGNLFGLKQSLADNFIEIPLELRVEKLDFESRHYDDGFLIASKNGLFKVTKDNFTITTIIDFNNLKSNQTD